MHDRTRAAVQIAAAVPPHTLHDILAAVDPRPALTCPRDGYARNRLWRQVAYLLLLLPPALHPAALQARCPDIARRRTLRIQELPEHPSTTDRTPARASLMIQALSAACILAGGHPQRIWQPESTPPLPPHLQLSPDPTPLEWFAAHSRKRSRQAGAAGPPQPALESPPVGAVAPGATGGVVPAVAAPAALADASARLTRLELTLADHLCEPRRAFDAIAQMPSLRDLDVHFQRLSDLHVEPLVTALHSLPALERLHLWPERPGRVLDAYVHQLLRGVCSMTGLVDLDLERCFVCTASRARRYEAEVAAREAIGQITRLVQLTRLGLGSISMCAEWAAVFVRVASQLPRLRDLCATQTSRYDSQFAWEERYDLGGLGSDAEASGGEGDDDGSGFIAQLCGPGVEGLPSLRSLDASCTFTTCVRDLLACLEAPGGGVLRRLAALNLGCCGFSAGDGAGLAALMRGMPCLESLVLRGNELEDRGVAEVARAMPDMPGLTCLDIGGTGVTVEGVHKVLDAAWKMGGAGSEGLRRLVLASVPDCGSQAARLAAGLRRLVGLEEVVLIGLGLGLEGLQSVLGALQAARGLRVLEVGGCGEEVLDYVALVPLFVAMSSLQRLEIGLPVGHVRQTAVAECYEPAKAAVERAMEGVTVLLVSTWEEEVMMMG